MAKRKRVEPVNIILTIILCIACFFLIFFVSRLFNESNKSAVSLEKETIKEAEETDSNLDIDFVDAECFDSPIFDFKFAVVRIRFRSDKAIRYSLDDIVTDEGIVLSKTNEYIDILAKENYFLSMKNITSEISSEENSFIASLFVPYTDDSPSLIFKDGTRIEFDTKDRYVDIETLRYEEGTFIESEEYQIYVCNAFIAGIVFEGEQIMNVPSSQKVYTFELKINSIEDGITLKKAEYKDIDGNITEALGEEYSSSEVEKNMFSATLEEGETYGLYFLVMSADSEMKKYEGELILTFSNSDEPVIIPADFE